MQKKVIDLAAYRVEKSLRESGFVVKKDDSTNIKILIKLKSGE